MNIKELLSELLQFSKEREWFEFKTNWFEEEKIGQYIQFARRFFSQEYAIASRNMALQNPEPGFVISVGYLSSIFLKRMTMVFDRSKRKRREVRNEKENILPSFIGDWAWDRYPFIEGYLYFKAE